MNIEKLHLPKGINGAPATTRQRAAGLARLTEWAGPFAPLVQLLCIGLLVLSAFRIALLAWQWPRVAATGIVPEILLQGVRADLILLGYFLAVPLLLASLLARPGPASR